MRINIGYPRIDGHPKDDSNWDHLLASGDDGEVDSSKTNTGIKREVSIDQSEKELEIE